MIKKTLLLFAVLCLCISGGFSQSNKVLFENMTLTLEQGINQSLLQPTNEEQKDGFFLRLIQFHELPGDERRSQLAESGIQLIGYYPHQTYLAHFTLDSDVSLLQHFDVEGLGKLPWQAKVSRDIFQGDIGDWALNGNQVSIVVQYPETVPVQNVLEQLQHQEDCVIRELHEEYQIIYAQTDINNLYNVAKASLVQFVSLIHQPGEPEDIEGRSLHRANMINSDAANGLKYDGRGVAVLTRDDGVVGPHIDYKGRLDNLKTSGLVTTDHADMVSGIFAGGGNLNPRAQGMASGADLYVVNYEADFMDNTLDLHQTRDVMVTNSSYSNGCNDGYTSITQTVDRQINNNPSLLHVFSAGNSGTLDCGYGAGNRWGNITGGHKIGKNVIATANLRIDVSLENSSSRGPASDGRLKPDLAARGTDQLSTDPNNLYSPGGGTSAASPGVAGVSAQLYHAYRDMNNGEDPESALIKAALMNTANDLGNEGPDYKYGWGHINAYRAYLLLQEKRYVKSEVEQSEESTHQIEVDEELEELRIMLYWREPAATPGSGKALVNDLDLVVTDEDGNEYLPWLLDPTPNAATLDQPAGNGRDELNNVEQVLLKNVEPGTYTVKIRGTALPFGKREYYLLHEIKRNKIDLTFPAGGEGFSPSEGEQIHWDARGVDSEFIIEYSTDGGGSWTQAGRVPVSNRTFTWVVPNEVSAQCHIRVTSGNASAMNSEPFSILSTPTGIRVGDVCPEFVELTWDKVEGANNYDVYLLGEKEMEVITNVDTNWAQVPIADVLDDLWFSIRAYGEDGLRSSRSMAVNHNEGLTNCSATVDLGIKRLLSPNENLVYSCDQFDEPVVLELENNGSEVIDDVTVYYQVDGGATFSESVNLGLMPGEKQVVSLMDNFNIPTGGFHDISVWIEVEDDELPGNNRIDRRIEILPLVTSARVDYSEDFEGQLFPPIGYEIDGEVDIEEWVELNAIGSDGQPTTCASIFNESSREIFYDDILYTEAIDLSNTVNPVLFFDYAFHVPTNANQQGVFKVIIYSFCGERQVEQLIFREGLQMRTAPADANYPWMPSQSDHWQKLGFNLKQFAGNEIVIAFVMENGFGTSFHLDNINVEDSSLDFPSAEILISKPNPCAIFESVQIEAMDPNPDYEYTWSFGDAAVPRSATGPGPHTLRFLRDQDYTIILEVVDAESGAYASDVLELTAYNRPTPNFSYVVNDFEVAFENRSSRATSYLWEFGDGNTSTENDPVHTYNNSGTYNVILHAISACTTRVKEEEIFIETVNTRTESLDDVRVYPNPASDRVTVELPANLDVSDLQVNIRTMNGQLIGMDREVSGSSIILDISETARGIYFIEMTDRFQHKTVTKLIVQ